MRQLALVSSDLTLRRDYGGDEAARGALVAFLRAVHGLDLEPWVSAGHWGPDYRQVSYFDTAGRVVSNVSLYSVDLVVDGRPVRAAQLSGVGTLPDHRGAGLGSRLVEEALGWAAADHELTFCFADLGARSFYERLGLVPLAQASPSLRVEPREATTALRGVDLSDPAEAAALYRVACLRAPVSKVLGAYAPELLMFHALGPLRGAVYRAADLGVYVLLGREGRRCTVYDVVGPEVPPFAELLPYLAGPGVEEVVFGFVPDELAVEGLAWSPFDDDGLHDRGDGRLRGRPLLFPSTCHA